jgi:predicted metal-dependent hydrolase
MPLTALRLLFPRPAPEPKGFAVVCDGEPLDIRIRRNARARRYTLRIHAATRDIVLTMPARGSLREAKSFAQKHAAWIAARLKRLPAPAPFAHGGVLPLRGIPHRIEHRLSVRGTVWCECGDDGVQLLCVAGASEHIPRRVRDYLKREAKRDLDAASRAAARALGATAARVAIRDQVSRWGSCSTTGVLSYSWRLVLAPPFVLQYLAAHESAHLIEMNHSVRFWRLVERICPDFRRAKTWLDAHGGELHRYGAEVG